MTNRLAVFASYSKEEKILRSTIYYLSGLRKICQKIIFVSDNALPSDQKAKVEKIVDVLICKRHGEYDFGSYKRGFEYAEQNGLLNNVDELIFCNDSCYGPVFPLDAIFKRMDEKRCDFWGMIDSHEIPRHICSFFFLFKRKVFEDPGFSNFVHSWTAQNDFWGYVLNYEKKFTHVLEELGYKYGIVCDLSNRDRGECQKKSGNGFLGIFPCLLHSYGMPLIKKKVFNGAYGNDLHENPYKLLELIKDANEELYSIIVEELQEGSAEGNIDFGDRWAIPSKIFEKKSIVSFNIFDTLLIRPYKTLNDLFYHIEAQYNCCGFASARIEAEYRARCKYKDFEDVSLDQIYECIRPSIFKSYKAIELEWEKRILQPNPKILDFYNEAVKCKKKIVAVSDTYFSKEFLLETLKLKGYDKVSEVFVSCERNACKHNGKLFRIVKDELKSSGTDIVHIGSNSISDKASPEALGIAALQISTIVDDIKEKPGAIFCAALSKLNSLSFNILSGMFAYYKSKDAKKNSFYELGYFLAGPLAVGYSQYIQNTCLEKGIENVLFVSRDCCVLREVYNIIFSKPIKNHNIDDLKCLDFRDNDGPLYQKSKRIFVKETGGEGNSTVFEEWLNRNSLATVYLNADESSVAKSSERIFNERYRLSLYSKKRNQEELAYSNNSCHILRKLIEELLCTPVENYNSSNQEESDCSHSVAVEERKAAQQKKIYEGLLDFAKDYAGFFKDINNYFSFTDFEKLVKTYVENLNIEDRRALGTVSYTDNCEQGKNSLLNNLI